MAYRRILNLLGLSPPPRNGGGRPRIAVSLDHNWHNLLGLPTLTYFRLIKRSGGRAFRAGFVKLKSEEDARRSARQIIAESDGLLLSGGGDVDPHLYDRERFWRRYDHRRDFFELSLIREATVQKRPVLGICRGCQLLNVAHGGTLLEIEARQRRKHQHARLRTHEVHVEPDTCLSRLLRTSGRVVVRSLHGQAVDQPGRGLRVAAFSPDGLVEAVESAGENQPCPWQIGVQWHPELMFLRNDDKRLVDAFVHQARRARKQRLSQASSKPRSSYIAGCAH